MAPRQVITISSQVAVGLVGNSVIFPTMLALGVSPIALSTIMLSNHPGLARPEGLAMPADKLAAMLERLIALGYIEPDAVIAAAETPTTATRSAPAASRPATKSS